MIAFTATVSGNQVASALEGDDEETVEFFIDYSKSFTGWADHNRQDLKEAFTNFDLSNEQKSSLNAFADFLKECAK